MGRYTGTLWEGVAANSEAHVQICIKLLHSTVTCNHLLKKCQSFHSTTQMYV